VKDSVDSAGRVPHLFLTISMICDMVLVVKNTALSLFLFKMAAVCRALRRRDGNGDLVCLSCTDSDKGPKTGNS